MGKLPDWIYDLAVKILVESIKYPTILGDSYGDLVGYYADVLKEHGVYTTIYRVPDEYVKQNLPPEYNPDKPRYILLARVGSGDKILQFNGHYDVVSPGEGWSITDPFNPKIIDNRVYGRGATDMKGGIASLLSTLVYFASREDLELVVEAAIVPDEEIGGSTGTGYLVNNMGSKPDWVVIAEPSGIDNMWIGHKGLVWGYVKTYGVQTHGSTPWLGVNAFESMVRIASYFFERYIPMLKTRRSSFTYDVENGEYPTVTIGGKLLSPGSINILPGVSGFSIDRRLIVEEKATDVIRELEEFVKEASRELGVKAEFTLVQSMDPALTKPDAFIVQQLSEAIRSEIGVEPRKTICVGGLDLRYYTVHGIEAVAYGPGEVAMAHKVDEYIEIDKLRKAIDIYVDLINRVNNTLKSNR